MVFFPSAPGNFRPIWGRSIHSKYIFFNVQKFELIILFSPDVERNDGNEGTREERNPRREYP